MDRLTFLKLQPFGGANGAACELLSDCSGGTVTHEIITGIVSTPTKTMKVNHSEAERGCLTCCKRKAIDALRLVV